MDSFAIAGKADTVFKLIAAKAEYQHHQEECAKATHRLNSMKAVSAMQPCPFNPNAECGKPPDVTCAELDCEIWREIDGE